MCSLWSTALCVVFGVPLAWVLARTRFPGRSLVRALVVLPMVLPPVVGGVALLFTFQRNGGLLGEWLYDWFGLQFTFSTCGRGAGGDVRGDAVPRDHGRGRPPHDGPALRGSGRQPRRRSLDRLPAGDAPADRARRCTPGTALAWARALGEFGATITFAGNIQGRTQTVPLAVYLLLETDQGVAIALSLVLLVVSIVVLVALRDHWFGGLRDARS